MPNALPTPLVPTFMGAIVTTSLLTLSSIAFANNDTTIETVYIEGTRTNAAQTGNAVNATSVSAEQINSALAEHFQQIATAAPGTWVSRGSGVEHLTALRSPVLTGAGACGTYLASEDGIPLYSKNLCNVNQLMATDFRSAHSVDILRGPQSGLFGGNALFGVININSAASATNTANTSATRRINLGQSTLGQSTVSVELKDDKPTSSKGLSARLNYNNSPREHANHGQQFVQVYQRLEKPTYTRTDSLSLMNLEQETAGYIQGKNSYKDSAIAESNDYPEAYRDAKAIRGYSKFAWRNEKNTTLLTPYFRHNSMQLLMHFVPWQPVEKNQHSSIGVQFEHIKALTSATFTLGQDLEYTRGALTEIQYQPAPFNQAAFPEGSHYDYDISALNANWYARVQWELTDKISLTPSVSVSLDKLDYSNNLDSGSACENPNNCRFYRLASRSDSFRAISPSLALDYKLNTHNNFYARLAQGFRSPQASELYRLQSASQASLAEVKGNAYEIGLSGLYTHLEYALSAYQMKVTDDIFFDSERRYINNANTQHKGVEYSITWRPTHSLTLTTAGTLASHTYTNTPTGSNFAEDVSGRSLDTAPNSMYSINLRWVSSEVNTWDINWEKMGSYYTDAEANHNYAGHHLLHVGHTWKASKSLVWRAKISNLLNTRYAERADYAFGEDRYFPGLARRLTLEMAIEW